MRPERRCGECGSPAASSPSPRSHCPASGQQNLPRRLLGAPGGPRSPPEPDRLSEDEARGEREERGHARRGAASASSSGSRSPRAKGSCSPPRARSSAARLAAVSEERAAAAAAAARSRQALLTRARLLHRFGRFGYFRVLLEAAGPAGVPGLHRAPRQPRTAGRQAVSRAIGGRSRVSRRTWPGSRRSRRRSTGSTLRSRQEEQRVASLKTEREKLLVGRAPGRPHRERREVSQLSDKASRLERLLETLSRQYGQERAGRPPAGSGPWKGVLDWPARGTIVETFGRHRHPKFDTWTVSERSRGRGPARNARARRLRGEGDLRPVAGGVRQPRDPRPRRRHADPLRLAAGHRGPSRGSGGRGRRARPGRLRAGARRAGPVFRGAGPAEGQRPGGLARDDRRPAAARSAEDLLLSCGNPLRSPVLPSPR